jgi:hypothetical protein
MNIYQRLNEVRKVVEYLQKDKEVAGKYMVVTHDAVTALVRPRLVEHGILTVPNLLKSATLNTTMTTGKGIPIIRYEATYRVSFVNMETPEERVDVEIESHALDEGDKAPGKALSYAVKYALLKIFNIETGEDDESRKDMQVKKMQNKSVAKEAFDALPEADQVALRDAAMEPISMLHNGDVRGALESIAALELDNDTMTAFWSLFSSKERAALKKHNEPEAA